MPEMVVTLPNSNRQRTSGVNAIIRLGAAMWLLMVTTKELGTYQPVDVLSMGDGVLGTLVVTG
jgi:hypothetical protein